MDAEKSVPVDPPVEYIERRLVETLAARGVLPLNALRRAVGGGASDPAVSAILSRLMADGVVVRRPHRQCLWYLGYALREPTGAQADEEEIPAPFRSLLGELAEA
jgi:hypothetical protein